MSTTAKKSLRDAFEAWAANRDLRLSKFPSGPLVGEYNWEDTRIAWQAYQHAYGLGREQGRIDNMTGC